MATSRILSGSVRAISRKGTKLTPQRSAIVLVSSLKHLKLFKLLLKLTANAGLESQAEVVPINAETAPKKNKHQKDTVTYCMLKIRLNVVAEKTQAAVERVKNLISEQPDMVGLKIGVKTRGCNGQSYTLQYAAKQEKDDEIVSQDGLKIFIDRKALMHVIGTEMDYVEEELSSGFVFNNPNIKGTCGCGESFNV